MIFYSIIAFIGSIFASAIYFSFKIFGMIFGAIFHVIADIFDSFSGGGNEGKQDKASERNAEGKSIGQTTSNNSLSDKAKAILCIIAIVVGYVLYSIIANSWRPDKPTSKNIESALSLPPISEYHNFITLDGKASIKCDGSLAVIDFEKDYRIDKEEGLMTNGRYRYCFNLIIKMKALHDMEAHCIKTTKRLNENSGEDWAEYCTYHPDWCANNRYTIEQSWTYRDENENYAIAKDSFLTCYQEYSFVPAPWEWKFLEKGDYKDCFLTEADYDGKGITFGGKGETYMVLKD